MIVLSEDLCGLQLATRNPNISFQAQPVSIPSSVSVYTSLTTFILRVIATFVCIWDINIIIKVFFYKKVIVGRK